MHVQNPPENYFDLISPIPKDVVVTDRLRKDLDLIHVFVRDQKKFFKSFLTAKKYLKKDGMLWISWPKKASKQPTDLDEIIIRDFGLKSRLVDVKVCAVDEVWSGLKFVFRVKDRLT